MTMTETYNGWANWTTWNVALWLQNDPFLYNTAKACVTFCGADETPYDKFLRCADNGGMEMTKDGARYDDETVDRAAIVEMMADL